MGNNLTAVVIFVVLAVAVGAGGPGSLVSAVSSCRGGAIMPFRCLGCGATADGERPTWCSRCGAVNSFGPICRSPATAPPRKDPVLARELGAGSYAPPLGQPFDQIFGRLSAPAKLLVYGPPGSGKTTRCLQLAEALTAWGPVLYDSFDEGIEAASFRDKVARLEIVNIYLVSSSWRELSEEIATRRWRVVCVDSASRVGCTPAELDDFGQALSLTWLIVLEATKGNSFRGSNTWGHWSDVLVKAQDMKLRVEKNRYGVLRSEV